MTRTADACITKEQAAIINNYLTIEPKTETDCLSEDETIVTTLTFDNGWQADIKCCGVQFDKDSSNTAWTEGVLFNNNGCEVCCTEPCDNFLGTWEFEVNGNTYIANVKAAS